jgi:SAM-dependent methyltransferase
VKAAAHESLAHGDALAWFDRVYREARGDTSAVPWADLTPNPALVAWLDQLEGGSTALVVGCGLGDDAECIASRGLRVTAFDLSATAVAWCRERFPATQVVYEVADLLAPPERYSGAFDLVFEAYTIQSLPPASEERSRAIAALAHFAALGGTLLVLARFADALPRLEDGPPWALVRSEIDAAGAGLRALAAQEYVEDGVRRVSAAFQRTM